MSVSNFSNNAYIPLCHTMSSASEALLVQSNLGTEESFYIRDLGLRCYNHSLSVFVPRNEEQISRYFSCVRNYFNDKIGLLFPMWNKGIWQNSATDPYSLKKDARAAAPIFSQLCKTVSEQTNADVFFGPNDRFLIKGAGSLARKIIQDCKSDNLSLEGATSLIGDALRGTIAVESVEQLKQVVHRFNAEAAKINGRVAWKNIYNQDSEDGYVAVHGRLLLNFKNQRQQERTILTEIQIHFKSIIEGCHNSTKERMHILYKELKDRVSIAINAISQFSFATAMSCAENACKLPSYFLDYCKLRKNPSSDLCKDPDSAHLCKGNLGIIRQDMPQVPVKGGVRRAFIESQKAKGVRVEELELQPGQLQATQSELGREQILRLVTNNKGCELEVLASGNNPDGKIYIIDGHHRYAACHLQQAGLQKVIIIYENIKSLLEQLKSFPGIVYKNLKATLNR